MQSKENTKQDNQSDYKHIEYKLNKKAMFDFLSDITKGIGQIVGTVTGTIIGVPLLIVSETLGITVEMVKEAMDAGCETYEEIKEFFK